MVLVVGAGPAGATAARTLAQAGVAVRLLDRSNFPRNKPCGGAISFRVLRRFPYLEPALTRISTHLVSRLRLEGPDGRAALIRSNGPAALMIRRVEFDALLVDLAIAAGAELTGGVDIVQVKASEHDVALIARDGRRFSAPMVIAADGVHSVVARRLGLNPGWPARSVALDMMEETPRSQMRDLDPSTLWVAFGYAPRRVGGENCPRAHSSYHGAYEGYAYVFPKHDHVNVGIGYVLDFYREVVGTAPYTLQRAFVEHLKERGVIEGDSSRRHFTPFVIPVGGPLRRPGARRVLVAGDAGGFVNGFTAEGIYYAMVSGDLAARSVIETGTDRVDTLAGRYRRLVNVEIGAELRDSVLIQRYLFGDRRRIDRFVDGARRRETMTRRVLDFAIGHVGYRRLRRELVASAPLTAAHMLFEHWREADNRSSNRARRRPRIGN